MDRMSEARCQVRSPFAGVLRGATTLLVARLVALGGAPTPVAADCTPPSCGDCGLDADVVSALEEKIANTPVYMTAIDNMRCTLAGRSKFRECGITVKEELFAPADISTTWSDFSKTSDGTWKYLQCKYPVEENGMVMHSYVFVNGKLVGDGFDITAMSCSDLGGPASTPERSMTRAKWTGTTVEDLHNEYYNIFKTRNRNAASHLWTKFLLERSKDMSHETFVHLFQGYCAVSGSPVNPSDYKRYRLTLDRADGTGKKSGFTYHCCWPCLCDTQDFIKVDTMDVTAENGESKQYNFLVIGDPCVNKAKLEEEYEDTFGGYKTSLLQQAPEVACEDGQLVGAHKTDNGYVAIGMFFDAPEPASTDPAATQEPEPGRMTTSMGFNFQDERELAPQCKNRAENGYNSGMGEIFRKVAAIAPVNGGKTLAGEGGSTTKVSTEDTSNDATPSKSSEDAKGNDKATTEDTARNDARDTSVAIRGAFQSHLSLALFVAGGILLPTKMVVA